MPMKLRTILALAVGGVLATASQALAALPPEPKDSTPDKPYVAYGIAAILIAAVCVATFKSSKRTHLD